MKVQGLSQPTLLHPNNETKETRLMKLAKDTLGKPGETDLYDLDVEITEGGNPDSMQATGGSHFCPPKPSEACSGVYTCNHQACTGTVCSHC